MAEQPTASRFAPPNQTTHERLSSNTVGLVNLGDYRKRRAEVIEQQEREAREAVFSRTPDRSRTATPGVTSDASEEAERQKKKKAKRSRALVSFAGDDDEDGDASGPSLVAPKKKTKLKQTETTSAETNQADEKTEERGAEQSDGAPASEGADGKEMTEEQKEQERARKIAANSSVPVVPRLVTKAAQRREAAEREALRKEWAEQQAAIKATEIAIPFVFHDGTNIPGGIVRVKKGDHVWLFLDKSRKVGAELGVRAEKNWNARRGWARVGVDDLMLVRGSIIIPHHYALYYFMLNKVVGPDGKLLFDYSTEPPANGASAESSAEVLTKPGQAGGSASDINTLEGASDDPTFTKVVDRRWYQRHKHIYPASTWQEYDHEKDYSTEIPRDLGGNAFFFGGKR